MRRSVMSGREAMLRVAGSVYMAGLFCDGALFPIDLEARE
jgi:hypothetical protein